MALAKPAHRYEQEAFLNPTQQLADYIVSAEPQSLPPEVVHEAKRSFLNWLGVAIGASRHPTVEIALKTVLRIADSDQAALLGRSERCDMLYAAFINGTSSHVFDFDDTHLRTIIHPSGPVAPALLALAEAHDVSGMDFLHAFVLGVEVECRIGNAVYPSHYDVGWHITATTGVFGAAAAAGKLMGLDAPTLTQALGIAATQSSGLREMFGTMCKPFHVGNAAKNGLFAALLASEGFTSSLQALEAPRGFAHVLATERDFTEITEGLGEHYEILKNSYKPFACGIVIHPSIDGCIQLRDAHLLDADEIGAVHLKVHPLVLELTGKKEPKRGLEGKFSVYHSAAVALLDGAAGEEQYSDDRVNAPEVITLRGKVEATTSEEVDEAEAYVEVTLKGGSSYNVHVEHAIGSLERPMSDSDLEAKFRGLVSPLLPAQNVEQLIDLCWMLDRLPDAAMIAKAAVPA